MLFIQCVLKKTKTNLISHLFYFKRLISWRIKLSLVFIFKIKLDTEHWS